MTPHHAALQLANSLPIWIFCGLTIALVLFQTYIFIRLGKRCYAEADITKLDVHRSVKVGLISTIGPVFSIFVVGLGLISQIGAPMTVARLNVIGNTVYETFAAEMGAAAMGTSLNADDYSTQAFVCSVWVMNLGGICMILPSLFLIKPFSKVTQKVESESKWGLLIAISATVASIGYFVADAAEDIPELLATGVAFLATIAMEHIAKKNKLSWISEWSAAIAIIIAIAVVMIYLNGV